MHYPTDLHDVAIYLRKSRQDAEAEARGEGETLSKHKRALMQVANQYGYAISAVYEEIVSGERILERPQMQALLNAVREMRYTAVLCMDIDRLGRGNMIDQGLIQDVFKSSGTLIITPRKVYDLRDELDEEWSEFEAFLARRELKVINRRLQRGRRQSAGEGKSISARPPYGYMRGADLKLSPHPETAPIVQLIFRLAAEGNGTGAIANYLSDHGIQSPTGMDTWLRSTVRFILHNPVYRGHIVWGRLRYRKTPGIPGYRKERAEPDEWIRHPYAHEPLVDDAAYALYLSHKKTNTRSSTDKVLVNPLATLIYCDHCRRAMRFQKTYNRRHNRLVCTTRRCPTRSASFACVEQKILESLDLFLSDLTIEPEMRNSRDHNDDALQIIEKQIGKFNEKVNDMADQRGRLHDLLEQGVYDASQFRERYQVLVNRTEALQKQLAAALAERDHFTKTAPCRQNEAPVKVIDAYAAAPTARAKNDLLKSIIERVSYRRAPDWRKPDQFELEIFLHI